MPNALVSWVVMAPTWGSLKFMRNYSKTQATSVLSVCESVSVHVSLSLSRSVYVCVGVQTYVYHIYHISTLLFVYLFVSIPTPLW